MAGYTQTELDDIQAKWNLRFPPDLVALLRARRKVIEGEFGSFDWLDAPDETIKGSLDWPLEGFLFDVQHGLWWPEWGDRPDEPHVTEDRLKSIFAAAPKLIPVCGHRYIPEEPNEDGNPVFSVWQMDVICYGANLDDYIRRELNPETKDDWPDASDSNVKQIPFWTRAVEFNNQRFSDGRGFAFFNKGSVLPEP